MPIERADSIIDLTKIDKEVAQYIMYIEKAKAALVDLFNVNKQFKDSNIVDLTKNTKDLSVAMDGSLHTSKAVVDQNAKLIKSIEDLVAAMGKQNKAGKEKVEVYAKSKYQNDQEIRDNIAAKNALKQRTDALRAEGDAYKQLIIRQKEAEVQAKALSAQYGIQSKEAKAAVKASYDLSEQIQKINKATGDGRSGVGRYAEGIKDVGREALALGGIAGAFELIKSSIEAAVEKEENLARLKNTLDNLGKIDTFARLESEAKRLVAQFNYLETDDLTPVFEKLITYGKLSEQQLKDLTPVIINLAAKQRISLTEASDVITKALEGNAKGLKTFGINMKDAGTEAERLSIIMTTLKEKVEGAGETFGKTTAGQIKETKKDFHELQEELGGNLLPVLNSVLRGIQFIILGIGGLGRAIKGVAQGIADGYLLIFDRAQYIQNQVAKQSEEQQEDVADSVDKFIQSFNLKVQKLQGLPNVAEATAKLVEGTLAGKRRELDTAYQLLASARAKNDVEDKIYYTQRTKTLSAQIAALIELNQTLGVEQEEKPKDEKGNKQKLKDLEDYSLGFKKILEDIDEFNKKSLNIDTTPLQKELNEAYATYSKFFTAIRDLRQKDLKDLDNEQQATADALREKGITPDEAAKRFAEISEKRKQIAIDEATDLERLENAHQVNIAAITEKYRKLEEQKRKQQTDKDFAEALKNADKIASELKKRSDAFFDSNILQAKADLAKPGGNTVKNQKAELEAETQKILAELNQQHNAGLLSDQDYNNHLIIQKKAFQDANEDIDRKAAEEAVARVSGYVHTAEDLLGALTKLRTQTELNALQEVENAQQKNFENQVKRINGSTLNEVQKAARLAQLEAQRQVQQDQNERKRRQIAQEEARFEKAKNIAEIILNTAAGVAKAIPNPILMAIAAAVGAVQLTIAAATPIPAYGEGIFGEKYHPGGLAVVGDKYKRETIFEPNKAPYLSPAKPTLTSLAKFTQVFPTERVEEMRLGSMRVNPFGNLVGDQSDKISKEIRELKEAIFWQTGQYEKIMGRAKAPQTVINIHPGWDAYINKYVRGK